MKRNINKIRKIYEDKMVILEGAKEEFALTLEQVFPNEGAIIRPDGDVRLDCIAPFTIGNILETPFIDIWKRKAHNAWNHPEIDKYIKALKEGKQPVINHLHKDKAI